MRRLVESPNYYYVVATGFEDEKFKSKKFTEYNYAYATAYEYKKSSRRVEIYHVADYDDNIPRRLTTLI